MSTFVVKTDKGNVYELFIVKEKYKEEYRIFNKTKCWITPCVFESVSKAIDDIKKYESEGRLKVISESTY